MKRIGGYYENVLSQNDERANADELECAIIKESLLDLPKLLAEITPPQVIKSFILEQLDRLPPTTQQVAKESALVGEFFSRQGRFYCNWKIEVRNVFKNLTKVIYHLNSIRTGDEDRTKVDRAFQQLIDAKIIEPIKTSVTISRNANEKSIVPRKSSLVKKINIKVGTQCDHLRFTNPFYHEVIDNLWIESQRLRLHIICAAYFTSSLEEIKCKLLTTKYREKPFTSAGNKVSNRTITEFAVHRAARHDTIARQKNVCSILNLNVNEFDERRVDYDLSHSKKPLWTDNSGLVTKTSVVDDMPDMHQVEKKAVILGSHMEAPQIKLDASTKISPVLQKSLENRGKLMSKEDVSDLEESLATHYVVGSVSGVLPGEADLFKAVLYPVVMRHVRASRNTEETIEACLGSADALLKTSNVKDALSYLDMADEIISNLDGRDDKNVTSQLKIWKRTVKTDIIKGETEGETNFHNLDELVTVYKVHFHV